MGEGGTHAGFCWGNLNKKLPQSCDRPTIKMNTDHMILNVLISILRTFHNADYSALPFSPFLFAHSLC